MVYVDFHCHLDFKNFDVDREEVTKKIIENNIIAITNTTSFENYIKTKNIFENINNSFQNKYNKEIYNNIKITPGLYPQNAEKISEKDFETYLKFLRDNKDDFVAIGEIGLDKHHTDDENLFNLQIDRFKKIIELGIELDKPLIIHTRKAEKEVLEIIQFYVEKTGFNKFDLHCFMGKKKFIQIIKDLNIYCSIPLSILNNESFRNLVKELKIKQILVETDSPFLNPDKTRNSPLNVPKIYEEIAKIKSLDSKEIENIIFRNFMKIIN